MFFEIRKPAAAWERTGVGAKAAPKGFGVPNVSGKNRNRSISHQKIKMALGIASIGFWTSKGEFTM